MRLEDQLLLLGSRTAPSTAVATHIRDLAGRDVDWDEVVSASIWQRTAPLVYRSLTAAAPDLVPSGVLARLASIYRAGAARSLALTQALVALLPRFAEAELAVLPYKGPVLASLIYGNLSLRPFDDLDLLIHRQDFQPAKQLLLAQGYHPSVTLSPRQEGRRLRKYHDYRFQNTDGRVVIDLQWKIVERAFPFPLAMDDVWQRCRSMSFANLTVLRPTPEDLLLMLLLHGAKHMWQRLIWLCDVAEMLRGEPALDWGWLLGQAAALGGQRMLYLGLGLAQRLLEAPLPMQVAQAIATDPAVGRLTDQVQTRLLQRVEVSPPIVWERRDLYLQMMERRRDRVRLRLHYYPRQLYAAWAAVRDGAARHRPGPSAEA